MEQNYVSQWHQLEVYENPVELMETLETSREKSDLQSRRSINYHESLGNTIKDMMNKFL